MVVAQDGIEQRRDQVGVDALEVVRTPDVRIDETQDILLDGAKTTHHGRLGGNQALGFHLGTDNAAHTAVQRQHIEVYTCDLRQEEWANGGACRHVRLEHVGQNLDVVRVTQHIHVAVRLLHEVVPGVARQLHELRHEPLLRSTVRLRGNHVADGLVERVHLLRR